METPLSLSGNELMGVVILFIVSAELFLICDLCFLRSANVPLIVTKTVTLIFPFASVVYVVSFWASFVIIEVSSRYESLSLPSGALRSVGTTAKSVSSWPFVNGIPF